MAKRKLIIDRELIKQYQSHRNQLQIDPGMVTKPGQARQLAALLEFMKQAHELLSNTDNTFKELKNLADFYHDQGVLTKGYLAHQIQEKNFVKFRERILGVNNHNICLPLYIGAGFELDLKDVENRHQLYGNFTVPGQRAARGGKNHFSVEYLSFPTGYSRDERDKEFYLKNPHYVRCMNYLLFSPYVRVESLRVCVTKENFEILESIIEDLLSEEPWKIRRGLDDLTFTLQINFFVNRSTSIQLITNRDSIQHFNGLLQAFDTRSSAEDYWQTIKTINDDEYFTNLLVALLNQSKCKTHVRQQREVYAAHGHFRIGEYFFTPTGMLQENLQDTELFDSINRVSYYSIEAPGRQEAAIETVLSLMYSYTEKQIEIASQTLDKYSNHGLLTDYLINRIETYIDRYDLIQVQLILLFPNYASIIKEHRNKPSRGVTLEHRIAVQRNRIGTAKNSVDVRTKCFYRPIKAPTDWKDYFKKEFGVEVVEVVA